MKKILFLLLLSVTMYGQVPADATPLENIQITNNIQDTISDRVSVSTSDGVLNWKYAKDLIIPAKAFLSTGLIKNGLISASPDDTKFNITAGIGIISNFNDPENPTSTIINFPAFNFITPTYLNTGVITYVAINAAAAVVMQATPFTPEQRRSLIILGAVIHSDLTTINLINNISAPSNAGTNQLHDFIEAVGALNLTGNKYTANGANLQLNKSAGLIFKLGSNFANDWKNPHELAQTAGTSLTFRYRTQNGTEGSDRINLDPALYDLSNVLTAVPNNKFTIQTVVMFQSGVTRIQYGQNVYDDLATAKNAVFTRNFVLEPNSKENGIIRAYIIMKNTTTSLQNISDADILEAQKFGGVASGGVALTLANIVTALGYTPENVANKQNSLAVDGTGTKYATVDAISGGTLFKATISQIRALTGTLPNNNFYTTDLGQEGNWYYDATDVTSTDNTGTILVTADGKRIKRAINGKISPLWFGAKGDSTTDDTTAFQNAINYLGTTFTNSESSAMASAELNRIILDLQGKAYLINSEIVLPVIQTSLKIGGFTIEGGKLIIGNGLQSTSGFLFHFTDAGKIVFQNLTIQGKDADSTNRNCFLIDGVSINVKIINVSGIDTNIFLRTSDTTFDVSVSNCYVRTYSAPFPAVMVDVAGDAMFNNNYFIGCSTAISTRLGGNIIRGNHFYGAQGTEPLGVVCNDNASFGSIISSNYFDGFGIKMYAYGQASIIEGNTFPNANVYTPIKLVPFSAVTLGKVLIKDNAIMYLSAKTPVMTAVPFDYSFSLKKITLTGVETFTDKHLGAIIEQNINQRIQIYSVVDSKNALVKAVSVNDFTTGSYVLDINPNPVLISNNETLATANLRKNIFIYDNVVSMNTPSGFLNIYPLTMKSESEYYNQVIKKTSQAFRIEGTDGITFNLPSDDFNNIKFQINGVTKGRIGTTGSFLRLASSTTSSRSLLLSDTVLRPEAGNVMALGTTSERYSNAFLERLTLTTPTTSAGTYDLLTRNTSTGEVEKVLSNTIAPIASPALTGTPTAPTATAGTNTTQVATTAFVAEGLSTKIGGSGTLNFIPKFTATGTIGNSGISEVSGITTFSAGDVYIFGSSNRRFLIGDNSSVSNYGGFRFQSSDKSVSFGNGYLNNSLVRNVVVNTDGTILLNGTLTGNILVGKTTDDLTNKLQVAGSGSFTGAVTAATATAGTNTTQVATTAFVQNAVSSGTYTPTLTNTTNISSSTLNVAYYTKIGDLVTVNIAVQTTITTTASATVLTFSLPISGATTANGIGQGNLTSGGAGVNGYGVVDITNSTTGQLRIGKPDGTGAGLTNIIFTYSL